MADSTCSVDGIPDDVIMHEVLPRLPVKSLFRFKSVCKKWRDFITNDHLFSAIHYSHSTSTGFLLQEQEGDLSTDNPDYHFKLHENLIVSGSTRGLLYGYHRNNKEIYVCNPVTKQEVFVPNPNRRDNIVLAVDAPFNCFMIIAVLDTFAGLDENCFKFEVYSSKEKQWRASNAKLQVPSPRVCLSHGLTIAPVCAGGCIYWHLRCHMDHISDHVLWFDYKEDVAGVIPYPRTNNIWGRHYHDEIGVSNDELSYSKMTRGGTEIWLLKRNKGRNCQEFEWVKEHSVSLQEIFEHNWEIMSKFCRKMRIGTRKKAAQVMTSKRRIFPMPYLGGEVVWFWLRTREKDGKLLSINLTSRNLTVFGCHPLCPLSATLLPCSA